MRPLRTNVTSIWRRLEGARRYRAVLRGVAVAGGPGGQELFVALLGVLRWPEFAKTGCPLTGNPTGTPGAIGWYIDKIAIRPYEASFAAIGFAAAYRTYRVQRFADVAWDWCAWYQDHMDTDNTMYDYNIVSVPSRNYPPG